MPVNWPKPCRGSRRTSTYIWVCICSPLENRGSRRWISFKRKAADFLSVQACGHPQRTPPSRTRPHRNTHLSLSCRVIMVSEHQGSWIGNPHTFPLSSSKSTVEMTIMQTVRRRQNLCTIQFMHYKFDNELKLNWWRQTLCNVRFMHYNLCIIVISTVLKVLEIYSSALVARLQMHGTK